MTVETLDQTADPQPQDEARIVLEVTNSSWPDEAECLTATEPEMAIGMDRYDVIDDLSYPERAALRGYCKECPVQEMCLASAMLMGNIEDGVVGGLNPLARAQLYKQFDEDSVSVPKLFWDIAITAVRQGEFPLFPAQPRRNVSPEAQKALIIGFLSKRPEGKYLSEQSGRHHVYGRVAAEVELPPGAVRNRVTELCMQGIVIRLKQDGLVSGLQLAA
jgi:hypothetical protein